MCMHTVAKQRVAPVLTLGVAVDRTLPQHFIHLPRMQDELKVDEV